MGLRSYSGSEWLIQANIEANTNTYIINFKCSNMLTWQWASTVTHISFRDLLIHQRSPKLKLTKPQHNAVLLIPDPNQQYKEFFVHFFSWTVWGQWSKKNFKFGFFNLNMNVSPPSSLKSVWEVLVLAVVMILGGTLFLSRGGVYLYLPCSQPHPGP